MKYMGSKKNMLNNGLGETILDMSQRAERFVDLFSGSGAISWFAAEKTNLPVLSIDLQKYSSILSNSVISRTKKVDIEKIEKEWLLKALSKRDNSLIWDEISDFNKRYFKSSNYVQKSREFCKRTSRIGPIYNSYGGHYFSPEQAISFDFLLKCLPIREPERTVCSASLLSAASSCAAAPGHTAQPFQPTKTAIKFIMQAWSKDPVIEIKKALNDICPRFANVKGSSLVSDALSESKKLKSSDLVIIDPPYSGVHYSRFYHVLETIARGEFIEAEGAGRYPSIEMRPRSDFSMKGKSQEALDLLFSNLAKAKVTSIVTFPAGECSNGLSGIKMINTAEKYFKVNKKMVESKFSTLGGNHSNRIPYMKSSELILVLSPK